MSWMEKLYRTYEAGILLDLPLEDRLMPTSHTLQNAHINIVIDGDGNFKRASVLEKTQIVLPATESSAGRTGKKPPPHPLADKLQYVAKDYPEFGGKKPSFFDEYYKLLKSWCDSKYSHPKAVAVFNYIKKGTVISDLVKYRILFCSDGVLLTEWPNDNNENRPAIFKVLPKENKKLDQGSALVCWTIEVSGDPASDTWKDTTLQDSWNAFNSDEDGVEGLCFITGNKVALAHNHPAKIRHTGDKAKLISSNDLDGFTFLGKFTDNKESIKKLSAQSAGVGLITTQKAHNALRWLIRRQGFVNGKQVFVSWVVSGKPIPDPLADSWSMQDLNEDDLEEVTEIVDPEPVRAVNHTRDFGESYARQLRNYMAGYSAKLSPDEQITIIGIDSATDGRMGIIYYREMLRDEFFQRLEAWHTQFAWMQQYIPNGSGKKPSHQAVWSICAPVPKDIAIAAYGENADDAIKKKVVERLLLCIIDQSPLPLDLRDQCVRRAINRNAYPRDKQGKQLEWEKNLGIACALYKGFYTRHPHQNQRRDYAMALEEDYTARDYLYGRLLAIAEYIEEVALNIGGEKRPTTAARLMQRFADRPFETWRTIELALQPYMQRLRVSRGGFLTNRLKEIDAIKALFEREDFTRKEKLSGEFLLGYHCQRHYFKHKPDLHEGTTESGESA